MLSTESAVMEDRRLWALDQLLALCRNGSIPKEDSWIASVLDFLLVHGFFVIRKVDKNSPISAVSLTDQTQGSALILDASFMGCRDPL